ncbi:MAG: polyribonucleotide nucleotidyltransferase [Cloacibacillus porcorum]|uniref:polyribonucleotide nucleotidyltransferase n=1 Tax=Cloacibacillus porcorum TaxID=1197717 RepID=UPI0023F0F20B|nr:polyribonucleotide nucleotidyltransferase [Cloacibacillus porcorum]MCD7876799.1 polyribonucleotide nucleotidyltransferase [Cloacibacillus porcorum]
MKRIFELELYGKKMSFEVGRLAKQANAALLARHGDTALLVTTVLAEKAREGLDFFPLLVDFEERYYSAGKVPGGFIKREGRPSETAILSGRMIDRSIRSLFPEWMRNDVHVVSTVMSVDQKNPANILGINGASLALAISDIPWNGPIGAVRIGCINGELVVNPDETDIPNSTLDLVVAGHRGGITMVEAGAKEVSEDLLVDAMELANEAVRKIVDFIDGVVAEIGKPKAQLPAPAVIEEIDNWVKDNLTDEIYEAVQINQKQARGAAIAAAQQTAEDQFAESYPDSSKYIASLMDEMVKKAVRKLLVTDRKRADGRAMDELRPITCEVDILPMTHGSALFTRGETQSLGVTTLGMIGLDDQMMDGLKLDEPSKRFILHYNFPPYSVGEVRPMRGPGRREIGHGALAERALRAVFPDDESFPYVVRQVSDILESNGSSSMASVCSGSLSMMAAGVPVKKAVAGIAMGLIADGGQICILTDIQGLEDHYGDMDFKVAGTRDGVTALQMDNKAGGITRQILTDALTQAKRGRFQILDIMDGAIAAPRPDLAPTAPKIVTFNIDPEKIRDVIGSGGKTIRGIVQQTGAKVDVEDSGKVSVAAVNDDAAQMAVKIIKDIVREVEAGETFVGTVTRMLSFGAFVEVLPGKEGLLHVSEISNYRVPTIEAAFEIGDKVIVTVKEIDDMHRVNLSRKRILDKLDELALDPVFAEQVPAEKAREERYSQFPKGGGERRDGGGRDRGDRDRGYRGHDRSRGGSSDCDRQGRPARRFERDRKN